MEFHYWLKEAKEAGIIGAWVYQPEPYKLLPKQTYTGIKQTKTKTKEVEKFLLHPLTYKADYLIYPNPVFDKIFIHKLFRHKNQAYYVIDVKGEFNRKNTHRIFSMHQKLVYAKYGDFVNMLVPEKFFNLTWVPKAIAFKKNRKVPTIRKPYKKAPFLSQIKQVVESYKN